MKLDENVIPHKTLGHYMASRKKPLVVISRKLPDSVETRMCELFDTRLNLTDKPLSPAELAEAVKTADVLVPTVTDRIDADLIVWAAGVKGADEIRGMSDLELTRGNQIVVRPTLQSTTDDRIYALGDCASCLLPGRDRPVPPRAQSPPMRRE